MKKKVRLAPPPHDTRTYGSLVVFFSAVVALCALTPSPGLAQNKPATWAIQVAEDSRCARAPGFRDQLAAQIPAEQRAPEASAELVAQVRVVKQDKSLVATVTVLDRVLSASAGERSITLPVSDCEPTADALALVIAVLVEAGRGAPVEEVKEPEPEPPAEPPPPDPPKPTRKTPKQRYAWLGPRPGYDLVLGAGAGGFLLPGVAWGGTFQWGLRIRELWPIYLGATMYLPAYSDDGRGRFRTGYASVATCPLYFTKGRARARVCPSFSAGMLKAEGREFLESRKVNQPVVLLGAELGADVRLLGPLTVGAVARADLPLMRPRFTYYDEAGTQPPLHQPGPVAISCFLTVGLRFR